MVNITANTSITLASWNASRTCMFGHLDKLATLDIWPVLWSKCLGLLRTRNIYMLFQQQLKKCDTVSDKIVSLNFTCCTSKWKTSKIKTSNIGKQRTQHISPTKYNTMNSPRWAPNMLLSKYLGLLRIYSITFKVQTALTIKHSIKGQSKQKANKRNKRKVNSPSCQI